MTKPSRWFLANITLFTISFIVLAGCSTTTTTPPAAKPAGTAAAAKPAAPPKDTPETVLITYHVKPAMEPVFEHLLSQAWDVYRKNHLVHSEPHVIVREADESGRTSYIEVFTWNSHATPDHAPEAVKQIWAQEVGLCEMRGGHPALGGGEVGLVIPAPK